jgi:hypothetical protein
MLASLKVSREVLETGTLAGKHFPAVPVAMFSLLLKKIEHAFGS